MKPTYLIALFVGLLTLLLSCEQERLVLATTADRIENELNLIELLTTEADGVVFVADVSNTTRGGLKRNTYIRTSHNENSILQEYPLLSFNGDFSINLDNPSGMNSFRPNPTYEMAYGKDLNLSLTNSNSRNDYDVVIDAGYVPELLNVTNSSSSGLPELDGSHALVWNADTANHVGVYIVLEYSPADNDSLANQHPHRFVDYKKVNDSGSYTINLTDFPNIPQNSIVFAKVIRGNAAVHYVENATSSALETDLSLVVYSMYQGFFSYYNF